MTRSARLPFLALIVGVFSGALGACQALAGIEDRSYDPSGVACQNYCALAKQLCIGASELYSTDATCLGVCKLLAPGNSDEPTGDTIACRTHQLLLAQQTNEPNGAALYCAHAGPATNGACAENCETYCALFSAACTDATEPDQCVDKCKGLKDTGSFDVNTNFYDDTLQCRFVHISVATVDATEHCPHAALPASGPCRGEHPETTVPDCGDFCHLETTECQGEHQQYESLEQCLAVCDALDKGTAEDQTGNSVACRKYHSYNALLDPITHCSHTGPGGEGHCGASAAPETGSTGNCQSYCTLLAHACPSAFVDETSCELACTKLEGAGPNSNYSTAASGDNVQCRLLHVSRALSDATECSAATGAAPCQ